MANLIRRAKSGDDWTANELNAYNITVVHQDAATFFERPVMPQPNIVPEALTALDPNHVDNDDAYELLSHMDFAMSPAPAEESAVDDFAVLLLQALGYTRRGRHYRTRKDIPFVICGEQKHAKTDVCIIEDHGILLLVQEDKRHMANDHPGAQLIAEAIAAFAANNEIRRKVLRQPPLPSKIMLGITMRGTMPTFYKISVTTELVVSVGGGAYPNTPTTVYAHVPSLPRPHRRWSEGMKPLDNREIILSCYEAFKTFVN